MDIAGRSQRTADGRSKMTGKERKNPMLCFSPSSSLAVALIHVFSGTSSCTQRNDTQMETRRFDKPNRRHGFSNNLASTSGRRTSPGRP
jgi:hypothetical protein